MATIDIFAPAKINLFLHVTGRQNDGYHLLDSLVVFADIGDDIVITEATDYSHSIQGLFRKALDPTHQNSITDAVHLAAKAAHREPHLHIKLTKNLPVASGIGGGSSDAAATLLACQRLWKTSHLPTTAEIVSTLGADVPVCLHRRPTRVGGIGDVLNDVGPIPACDLVLVNPGFELPTAAVFKSFNQPFSTPVRAMPTAGWRDVDDLAHFIDTTRNDLEQPATTIVPAIGEVLRGLSSQAGCRAARMSGSGATCFGLFATPADAQLATINILRLNAGWWVKAGRLLPSGPPLT